MNTIAIIFFILSGIFVFITLTWILTWGIIEAIREDDGTHWTENPLGKKWYTHLKIKRNGKRN
jgi:hypothetical protein